MKKISFLIVLAIAAISLFGLHKYALAVVFQPLGGRVITTEESLLIACPAGRAITAIYPFNLALPTPYYVPYGMPMYQAYTLGPGSILLANYLTAPVTGVCYNPETLAPIPVFTISPFYGTTSY